MRCRGSWPARPRPTPGPCPFCGGTSGPPASRLPGGSSARQERVEFAPRSGAAPGRLGIIRRPDFPAGDTHQAAPHHGRQFGLGMAAPRRIRRRTPPTRSSWMLMTKRLGYRGRRPARGSEQFALVTVRRSITMPSARATICRAPGPGVALQAGRRPWRQPKRLALARCRAGERPAGPGRRRPEAPRRSRRRRWRRGGISATQTMRPASTRI